MEGGRERNSKRPSQSEYMRKASRQTDTERTGKRQETKKEKRSERGSREQVVPGRHF